MTIKTLIDRIIKREGGYANVKGDKGGPTNRGITLKTLATWRSAIVSADDVKNMPRSEAVDIYAANYYLSPRINLLPDDIQEHVMDIGVVSGPQKAVMLLQQACNILGSDITVDGSVGAKTIEATNAHPHFYINNVLVVLRCAFFNEIANKNVSQKKFIKGWLSRAKKFRVPIG